MRATATIAVVTAIGIIARHPEAATAQVALSTPWTDRGQAQRSTSDRVRGRQSQLQKLNCGLDVAYLLLVWQGHEVALDDLANRMVPGEDRSRLVTFRDIQELVVEYGIDTRALRASEPSVLFGVLQRPAIVRLRRVVAGLDIGHYVLVLPVGLDLIVLDGALPISVVP